jgi:predicted transcriptional regulator
MENINVIHQFILLRAHSMSLGRIAEELGVSKASLSGWDRKYAEYIKQMKVDAYEALREESRTLVTERLKGVIQGLEKLYSSLAGREHLRRVQVARTDLSAYRELMPTGSES